jgi:hypothetical protein
MTADPTDDGVASDSTRSLGSGFEFGFGPFFGGSTA